MEEWSVVKTYQTRKPTRTAKQYMLIDPDGGCHLTTKKYLNMHFTISEIVKMYATGGEVDGYLLDDMPDSRDDDIDNLAWIERKKHQARFVQATVKDRNGNVYTFHSKQRMSEVLGITMPQVKRLICLKNSRKGFKLLDVVFK